MKGLEPTLEPTIGNFDQDHVNNWYVNLKQFSVVLMKQIVTYCDTKTIPIIGTSILNNSYYLNETVEYCDKTKQKTQKNINKTKRILKEQLKKEDYEEIKNTMTSNETAAKKLIQQLNF